VRVTVHGEEVPDDWAERWKRFHAPVLVGGRIWVRPPWEEPAVRPGVIDLVIDPGRAFGTGAHPTTRLCLELLLGVGAGGSFADLGCGSGVLAIAAAKLGFSPVLGLDHEREAVAATRANAAVNGVAVEARRWDLRTDPVPAAPVMLANLVRSLLLTLAERMAAPPRVLIASGLLAGEADEVAHAFALRHGLRETDRREAEGWAALALVG
jgi:ribosomal protein L11 methyltransferase